MSKKNFFMLPGGVAPRAEAGFLRRAERPAQPLLEECLEFGVAGRLEPGGHGQDALGLLGVLSPSRRRAASELPAFGGVTTFERARTKKSPRREM